MVDDPGPVLAAPGASPSDASRPELSLDDGRWHNYESNPVPWWVALVWVWFIAFGLIYLLKNMIP